MKKKLKKYDFLHFSSKCFNIFAADHRTNKYFSHSLIEKVRIVQGALAPFFILAISYSVLLFFSIYEKRLP
jgi:hypothetical protein